MAAGRQAATPRAPVKKIRALLDRIAMMDWLRIKQKIGARKGTTVSNPSLQLRYRLGGLGVDYIRARAAANKGSLYGTESYEDLSSALGHLLSPTALRDHARYSLDEKKKVERDERKGLSWREVLAGGLYGTRKGTKRKKGKKKGKKRRRRSRSRVSLRDIYG